MPRRRNSFPYRLRITWEDGVQETDDPYRFSAVLGEMDVWLLAEGSHLRPFERLGAHLCEIDGVPGTAFAVWAPDAQRVSVVGDFNTWDGRRHTMRLRRECGVWEIFLPGVTAGPRYKFEIRARDGYLLPLKADPYGFQSKMRPSTASIVCALPPPVEPQPVPAGDQLGAPLSVYEVHLTSWRRADDGGFPDWQRIADNVIFEDDVDVYWARQRVLERLNYASRLLPEGVVPTIGPDGTGVGHILWYTLEAPGMDLGEQRAIQDWYVKFGLQNDARGSRGSLFRGI